MTYGLEDVEALARVCYHAQELSLLTAEERVDWLEVRAAKRSLDAAFADIFNIKERHVN